MANDIFTMIGSVCYSLYDSIKGNAEKKLLQREFLTKTQSINTLAKKSIFFFPVIASESCDGDSISELVAFIERRNAILIKLIIEQIGVIDLRDGDSRGEIIKRLKGFDRGFYEEMDFSEENAAMIDAAAMNLGLSQKKPLHETHSPLVRSLMNEAEADELIPMNEARSGGLIKPKRSDYVNNDDFNAAMSMYNREMREQRAEAQREKREQERSEREESRLRMEQRREQERSQREQERLEREKKQEAEKKIYKGEDTPEWSPTEKELEGLSPFQRAVRGFKQADDIKNIQNTEKGKFFSRLAHGNALDAGSRVIHRMGNTRVSIQDKKINSAEPTQLEVSFSYYVKGVCAMSSATINLAVKSLLHAVPTEEIIRELPKSRVDDTRFLIKLGRLLSKETKFFGDFLLNIKNVRKYFTGEGGGKDNWINRLKYLTQQNRYRKYLGNQILPTYSLVLSLDDVETMRVNTNGKFDLMVPKTARNMVEGLSLLNLIIIDEANEKIFWLEDASGNFDIIPMERVHKENSNLSQKDLMKVMLKIGK